MGVWIVYAYLSFYPLSDPEQYLGCFMLLDFEVLSHRGLEREDELKTCDHLPHTSRRCLVKTVKHLHTTSPSAKLRPHNGKYGGWGRVSRECMLSFRAM